MMKLSKFLKATAILASACLAFTGCSSTSTGIDTTMSGTQPAVSDSQQPADTTTNITFWYSWTDKIQENNENLTKQFNETVGKEKGIQVTAEYQGSYDDLHQKLQAAYVAGNTPAVTVMEIASIGAFAKNGVLEPLSPFLERDQVDVKDFQPGLMGNSYVDGVIYGLPYLRSTPILYMNTTILKEAGLDPTGPKTWDELAQYCRTIKEKTGLFGLSMHSYIWTYEGFLMQNGTTVLNQEETATNVNSKEAKEAVQFIKGLKEEGAIRVVAGADSDKIKIDVMNQGCAMWFASTADLTNNLAVAEGNGFEIMTCFMPKKVQYGTPTGGANLIMSSKISDREKEAAWEFINWMTSKEQTIYASSYTGYMPSRISAVDSDAMKALYEQKPQFKVAVDQLAYASSRPMNPGYAQASKAIVSALDAVWVNGQDVEQVFGALETEINKYLNE